MRFGPVPLADAEGVILAHSLALPSGTLRKGRRLSAADIASIREAGLSSVIAATLEPGDIEEDEAATALAALMAGSFISARPAATGRVNLHADEAGVLVVDKAMIGAFNAVDPAITLATLADFATVVAGQMVATVKIIPFAVPGAMIEAAASVLHGGAIRLHRFLPKRVGLIQTELPTVKESVLDKTARVTKARLERSSSSLVSELRTPHGAAPVADAVSRLQGGSDIVLVFGASAVCDGDDVIPAAIRLAGGVVERVGMPVDPGNLLVLGRLGDKPVIGVPGCARSPKLNGFDWVLDRLIAGVPVAPADIALMGVGGLLMEIPSRPQPRDPKPEASGPEKRLRVDAVLLAAGLARRMGGPNKLLSRFGGVPLVRRIAGELVRSPVASIVVVTGHQADAVAAALDGLDLRIAPNPDHASGLASSLKAGLSALPSGCDGALICLADMPMIEARHIARLVDAFAAAKGRAVVRAAAGGRPGNPVILPRPLIALAHTLGGDRGARRLIEESGLPVVDVEIGEAALVDVDTPQALAEAGGEL